MSFNSVLFLVFLTGVVILNYFSPTRYRTSLLLFASFIFIGYFNIESLFAILFFSLFNFYLAKKVRNHKLLYGMGLLFNIAAIISFNYFNQVQSNILFNFSLINFNTSAFIIALGLSFYSLQNISYLTDVFYNRIPAETSVLKFFLFSSFFPKLMSGPVMLVQEFIPQIKNQRPQGGMIISGAQLFLFGLFKKMVLADRLSPAVSAVFDGTEHFYGLTTLIGAYLFTLQLYFDFSGYTNMALGAARMLGFQLKENFHFPLRATSIAEFWRRWHVSLISWFTNYIYYPIVYKIRKHAQLAVLTGVFVTFMVSGFWHGIGFTFLLWAACHILYIWFGRFAAAFQSKGKSSYLSFFYKLCRVFVVFSAVSFSNIFFRAHSATQAFQLIQEGIVRFIPNNLLDDVIAPLAHGGTQMEQFNSIVTMIILLLVVLFERVLYAKAKEEKLSIPFVVMCLLVIMLFGIFNSGERFIYMQF